jgi:hypothetical protein
VKVINTIFSARNYTQDVRQTYTFLGRVVRGLAAKRAPAQVLRAIAGRERRLILLVVVQGRQ